MTSQARLESAIPSFPSLLVEPSLRILVRIVQIIIRAIQRYSDEGDMEISGQRKRHRHVRDARDRRQIRTQDEFRMKTRRAEHRMKQNGAVRPVAVSVRQRRVGVRKFAQRQVREGWPRLADGFGNKIADVLHRYRFYSPPSPPSCRPSSAALVDWRERSSIVSFNSPR